MSDDVGAVVAQLNEERRSRRAAEAAVAPLNAKVADLTTKLAAANAALAAALSHKATDEAYDKMRGALGKVRDILSAAPQDGTSHSDLDALNVAVKEALTIIRTALGE